MKTRLLAACAAFALCAGAIAAPANAQAQTTAATPSPEEAKAFVDAAETELAAMSEFANRMAWTQATYITDDTNWLNAKIEAQQTALSVKYAKEAARFDKTAVRQDGNGNGKKQNQIVRNAADEGRFVRRGFMGFCAARFHVQAA